MNITRYLHSSDTLMKMRFRNANSRISEASKSVAVIWSAAGKLYRRVVNAELAAMQLVRTHGMSKNTNKCRKFGRQRESAIAHNPSMPRAFSAFCIVSILFGNGQLYEMT